MSETKKSRKKGAIKKKTASLNKLSRSTKPEHYFILCNGKPVKHVKELADIMEHLEDQVFNHHVSNNKNDFAPWVRDVFKDITLAKKIAGIKQKDHLRIVLYKHMLNKALN